MKKIISIFLSLVFISLLCFSAFAVSDTSPIAVKTLNAITDDFRKALKNGDTEVSISKYAVYNDNYGVNYNYLIGSLSLMANDIMSYSYGKYTENIAVVSIDGAVGSNFTKITMTYPERYQKSDGKCDLDKVAEDKKLVSSRYLEAKNIVKRSMTDLEKALALYDYIVETVSYSESDRYDANGNPDYPTYSYMVSGLLLDRNGVCSAYAKLYASLLNDVGVPAITVSSGSMLHEWVMVCIDGEWYHADPTWDEQVYDQGYTALFDPNEDSSDDGAVTHYYFLKSDEEIKELDHTDWELSFSVNPDRMFTVPASGPSGKFDGMFFDSKNSEYLTLSAMSCINGYWYFTDINTKSVIRTKIDGNPEAVALPDSTEIPKYTYGYNDSVYISTNKSIYRFNTFTDKFTRVLGIPSAEQEKSRFSEMNISFGQMKLVTVTADDNNEENGGFTFSTATYPMDELETKEAFKDDDGGSDDAATANRGEASETQKPFYTKPNNINNPPSSTAETSVTKQTDNKSSSFDPIYIIIAAGVVVLITVVIIIIKRVSR